MRLSAASMQERLHREATLARVGQLARTQPLQALRAAVEAGELLTDPEMLPQLRQCLAAHGFHEGGERSSANGLAVAPDLSWLAMSGYALVGGWGVSVWPLSETAGHEVVEKSFHRMEVRTLEFHPSSASIWVVLEDENFCSFDVRAPDKIKCIQSSDEPWRLVHNELLKILFFLKWLRDPIPSAVDSISISPDGRWLAAAHADRCVRVYDLIKRRQARRIRGVCAGRFLRFSATGRYLVSVGLRARASHWRWHRDRRVLGPVAGVDLIDTGTWKALPWDSSQPPQPFGGRVLCARLSPCDDWLFTAKDDRGYLLHVATGDYIEVPCPAIHLAEFTPDGAGLVTAGEDNTVRGWAWSVKACADGAADTRFPLASAEAKAKQVFEVTQPRRVEALHMLPNGRWVLVGNDEDTRAVFCDLFGDDSRIIELARRAAAGEPMRFP